jgi:hypothetical protein
MGQLLTAGLQFQQRTTAAKAAEGEAKVAAQQEELGAIQREADRKGRLASALASQTASAGARGVAAFEGSPLSVLEEDIRREGVATERDIFQTRLAVLTGRARGKIARKQLTSQARVGLLSDVQEAAKSGGGGA